MGAKVLHHLGEFSLGQRRHGPSPVPLAHAVAAVQGAEVSCHQQGAVRIAVHQPGNGGTGLLRQRIGLPAFLAIHLRVRGNALPQDGVIQGGALRQGQIVRGHKKGIGGFPPSAMPPLLRGNPKIGRRLLQCVRCMLPLPAPVPPLVGSGLFPKHQLHLESPQRIQGHDTWTRECHESRKQKSHRGRQPRRLKDWRS